MKRFTLLAAIAAATLSFGIAAVASAQESPTPSPTTTTTPNLCGGTPERGGETRMIGNNEITLPGGGTFVIQAAPPAARGYTVCYVEGNARVTIASATCNEVSRDNPTDNESAALLLDAIVDSCEVIAQTPTPTPTTDDDDDDPTVTPTATGGGTIITPPDTGTAGLR